MANPPPRRYREEGHHRIRSTPPAFCRRFPVERTRPSAKALGKGPGVEITNHRLTSAARDVIKRAQQLAATRQHAELSPEHLLLALLSDRQTTAAQSLRGQGIDPDSVDAAGSVKQ